MKNWWNAEIRNGLIATVVGGIVLLIITLVGSKLSDVEWEIWKRGLSIIPYAFLASLTVSVPFAVWRYWRNKPKPRTGTDLVDVDKEYQTSRGQHLLEEARKLAEEANASLNENIRHSKAESSKQVANANLLMHLRADVAFAFRILEIINSLQTRGVDLADRGMMPDVLELQRRFEIDATLDEWIRDFDTYLSNLRERYGLVNSETFEFRVPRARNTVGLVSLTHNEANTIVMDDTRNKLRDVRTMSMYLKYSIALWTNYEMQRVPKLLSRSVHGGDSSYVSPLEGELPSLFEFSDRKS